MPRCRTLGVITCALVLCAAVARAESLDPYRLTVESEGGTLVFSAIAAPGAGGVGSQLVPGNSLGWYGSWSVSAPNSSFIFVQFQITNALSTAQDIDVSVNQPISGIIAPPTFITGSISGSVSDTSGDGNGANMSQHSGGLPLYEAFIDGSSARTLLDTSFNFSAPAYLTNPWDGGDFINEPYAGSVTSDIGIDVHMSISPLDSVTFGATFLVVPEPAAFALLTLGAMAVVRRRHASRN